MARPQTALSTAGHRETGYAVALIEGRGIGHEVGIAALDKDIGRAVLIQVVDCQTYVKTIHHLHLHTPTLILVPDTIFGPAASDTRRANGISQSTILINCLQEEFPDVPIEPVMRKYWSEDAGKTYPYNQGDAVAYLENKGLEFINQLRVEDEDHTALVLSVFNKGYALSAAAAIFKHIETKMNTIFAAHSLRITYATVEGTMMIDTETTKNLELVGNISKRRSKHSLFGTLDYTYTAMASRLLRANLLAPITVQSAIDARSDAVEELVQKEDIYTSIKNGLRILHKIDLDKLIAAIAMSHAREPSAKSSKPAASRVAQMLNIRDVVRSLPILQEILQVAESRLLRIIATMLADDRIANIEKKVSESLNDDAASNKKGGISAVNARVYAVKASINRLLDVARETYRENVADTHQLCRDLSEQYELPLQLSYTDSGGYSFTLRKEYVDGELPRGFINVVSKSDKWVFSTVELRKKNARTKDSLDETIKLSNKVVQDLLADILADIGALYKASEALALLDMLWSFAHASILRNYVRPEFTGTLAIKAGRHPILERFQTSAGMLVPNDVYCCDSSCFQIVQGPNMSGKSTYLRQIGLLTVMAMCGCFVPAEFASFRVHDALLSRLSNDDDTERSLSTFANEMASASMILSLTTSRSLILIDELGRGTSPAEGVAISHAIAEELIATKAFIFFATHFSELSVTLSRYPSVVNLHLAVQKKRRNECCHGMVFKYKIMDGPPEKIHHYGIELAQLADLPETVVAEGRRIAKRLVDLRETRNKGSLSGKIILRRKVLLQLRTQLIQALEHSTLPHENLLQHLAKIQREVVELLGETLQESL